MKNSIAKYLIQDWLFNEAEGKFDIDLAESGIQYHHFHDLDLSINYDLNYSLDAGKENLRRAIAKLYGVMHEQVAVTHGSQEALYLFYRSLIQPGDHVITFTPGWQQSWEVPLVCGAEVTKIALSRETQYQPSIEVISAAIKSNTRLIIINTPNNPTGAVYSDNFMRELIALCRSKNIFIINDEEYLTEYDKSIVKQYEHSASVSSLSKVYGFPGLRLGWFVSQSELVKEVVNYKRYTSVSNSSLCEYLGLQVIENHAYYLGEYQHLLTNCRKNLAAWVAKHSDLFTWIEPVKTPYAYLLCSEKINSEKFVKELLKQESVLVMPAEVFMDKRALRISYVRPTEVLLAGLEKIDKVISQLKLSACDIDTKSHAVL